MGVAQAQNYCLGTAPLPPASAQKGPAPAVARPINPTPCPGQTVIKVNVHYVLRDDGTGNFTETSDRGSQDISADYNQTWPAQLNQVPEDTLTNGYAFAKGLIWGAIIQSQQNPQMWLPAGNTTPTLPKRISYVLNGVYFHRDSYLYDYDPVNIGNPPSGTLNSYLFNQVGVNKGSEVNIFIMAQNSTVPNYTQQNANQYSNLTGGASSLGYYGNNLWMKLGNIWRIHLLNRANNNGSDQITSWLTAGALNHEIGHLLSLTHAFDPDNCPDTPSNGVSGNNLMDYGTDQIALTPCQIDQLQNELFVNYQGRGYTSCGCGPINSFFTLPSELLVRGSYDWAWLDARGSFWDNGTTSSYEVTEVDQNDQPISPANTVTRTITGEPGRYLLHLLPATRYRVALTLTNGCNSSTMTKYINTYRVIMRPAVVAPTTYSVFPNPTTDEFTVRTDAPLATPPVVRDAYGRQVSIEQRATRHEADGWHTAFRLAQARPGLYLLEMGTGAARTIKTLTIR